MAILTPSQLTSASNAVYFDNVSGSITPTTVRNLNTDWISSSILASQTSSLTVLSSSYAVTASFALNSVATFPYTGSAIISGSLQLTGSANISGSVSISDKAVVNTIEGNGVSTMIIVADDLQNLRVSAPGTGNKLRLQANTVMIECDMATPNSTQITGSLIVTDGITGSLQGTTLTVTGSSTFSGSVNGLVVSQSVASQTSSLDFSTANFFTSAVTGSTFFNITNPKAGETVNVLLTTVGVATASFSTNVKQVLGFPYIPTSGSGKNDILTFISFDGTSVYLSSVKNLV